MRNAGLSTSLPHAAPNGAVADDTAPRPSVLTLVRPVPDHQDLHRILGEAGYHVWRAASPAEAAEAALREPDIGILVCDLVLSGGSGTAFYESLRAKLPPERALALLVMAEAASINDVIMTLRAGAVDFLGRRLAAPHVIEAVRRAERIVRQRRAVGDMAAEVARLGYAAVGLGQQLAREVDPLPGAAPAGGTAEFARAVQLDDGAVTIHGKLLANRRQSQVTNALRAQTLRQNAFGELAANSASWAMLLDLYDKTLRGRAVSVSSLCLASGAPASTALRRIEELVEGGLIAREKDAADARRTLMTLTDDARERMNTYLDAIA